MVASARGQGTVAELRLVQTAPSHVQVSPRGSPPALPPNSTTTPRAASRVAAARPRAGGETDGEAACQVVPVQIQVSFRAAVGAVRPPKRTMVPAAPAWATDAP